MHYIKGRKVLASALCMAMLSGVALCGYSQQNSRPLVKLSVWWSDDGDRDLVEKMIEEFEKEHEREAVFEITVSRESVMNLKSTVLANPETAADIFMFADDQFDALRKAGALLEITENTEQVILQNGGSENGACRCAMYEDKLYAYPLTTGNGYFLYYNSAYFDEEDVGSLDRILDKAAANGKKMTMDYSSGWYIYSFFKGAGLTLEMNPDGETNTCNWNAVDTPCRGVDVAETMLRTATHEGFVSCDDQGFLEGVKNGTIIAGINGPWNAETVRKVWGSDFAAARLPACTIAGKRVQMCSFSGYKLMGVNPYSQESGWAMKLAEKLSSEEMQRRRFELVGECPSNVNAAASKEVMDSPAVAALLAQSEYAYAQRVGESYWHASYIFGITIAGGNSDHQDLQTLLDQMTREITGEHETD